ncbi:MAG TPA: cupin domain-containing protein [Gaiellaceae bacterium]|nr:cupin domain-containing protein [Gaiellaceae bacterium]
MVEIRDGERITSEGDFGVTLLADIEQFAAVEVRSAPGRVVPPLHAHARHAEAFFVREGELTFRLEDGEHRVGPETWVFVPPEVVHTFSVTGDEPGRFLDIHVPSCGFGDFVRGLETARSTEELEEVRSAFDQHPPPEYATGDPGLVVIRRTGGREGEKITDLPNRRATLLVDADELTVSEFAYGGGERGANPHVHHHHSDAFLVVDGEFTFHARDGSTAVAAATLLVFPPDVVHGFDNDSSETARTFNFHLPASGFANYLRGRNPDFDQHDPPDDGGVDPSAIVAVRLSG